MKKSALLLAALLALPSMVGEVSAADRGNGDRGGGDRGGGSARDSGGRGGFSRDASPSRSGSGERQSHSVQRDASPSRSFSERQTLSAPRAAPPSRDMRAPDHGTTSGSRSRIDSGTRATSEARQPGGMSSGTAFPRSEAHPRSTITDRRDRRQDIDRSRGSEVRRFDNTPGSTRHLEASRPDDRRSSGAGSNRSDERRSNANDQRVRIDRDGNERRSSRANSVRSDDARNSDDDKRIRIDRKRYDDKNVQRHAGPRGDQDRLHNGRKGDRRDHKAHRGSDRRGDHWRSASRSHWHGDIRHFKRHDFDKWRRGSWHHGHRHGRVGWWWVVGPSWYFYSGPVYPYPDPYVPPVVVISHTVSDDTRYWYYCEDVDDYYPYVEECASEWIPVPAEPEDDMPPRDSVPRVYE